MKFNNKNILTLVAIGFLFVALSSGLPYGYFTLMRFVVCAVAIYLAYNKYKENKESLWIWAFGFVAILFNPIIPIVLKRDVWEKIDLATGIFFIASILGAVFKGKIKNNTTPLHVSIENLKKTVCSVGGTVYVVGWIIIITNMVIYVWSILDKNFSNSGLPTIDFIGTFITACVGVVFLILGGRIKQLLDVKIKKYLEMVIAISAVLFIWTIWSGGRVGILFFIVFIYLIYGLVKVNKLMKFEDFTSKLINPNYSFGLNSFFGDIFGDFADEDEINNKKKRSTDITEFKKWEIFTLIIVGVLFLFFTQVFPEEKNNNETSTSSQKSIGTSTERHSPPVKTGLEFCQERDGNNATYDSVSNSCGCNTGYTSNGKSCVTFSQFCPETFPNTKWIGEKNDKVAYCECITGYGRSAGGSCIKNSQICSMNFPNTEWNGKMNDEGGLICDCIEGYQWKGTTCVMSNN